MKDTFTCFIGLEHIHDELTDVEIEATLDLYSGSNSYDDPSEIEVVSIKCVGNSPALEGQYIETTDELENQIINKYERR